MRRRRQLIIAIVGLFLLASFLFRWGLPRLVESLPGEIRGRIPEQVVALITTPLPTALPAPILDASRPTPLVLIPTRPPTATPSPSALPPTPVPGTNTPTVTASPTPTITPSPTITPTPLPAAVRLEALQVIPQKFNNCGPANLSMVLDYYGYEVDQLVVGGVLKPNEDDRNVSPHELAAYVHQETEFEALSFAGGSPELLKQLLAAGLPVIVEKGHYTDAWLGHYLTLAGYDDAGAFYWGMDSFLGPWDSSGRQEPYDELERYWSHFNNTFVVVYPPESAETVAAILGPAYLDPWQMWQNAAEEARRLADTEPANAYAWHNLGASLTHLGRLSGDIAYYENAALAFDQARTIGLPWRMLWYQFEMYEAYLAAGRFDDVETLTAATLSNSGGRDVEETYLYLGHLQVARGELVAAERSYREALELNPGFVQAQEALAQLGEVE